MLAEWPWEVCGWRCCRPPGPVADIPKLSSALFCGALDLRVFLNTGLAPHAPSSRGGGFYLLLNPQCQALHRPWDVC
jgi:hypothetical protein